MALTIIVLSARRMGVTGVTRSSDLSCLRGTSLPGCALRSLPPNSRGLCWIPVFQPNPKGRATLKWREATWTTELQCTRGDVALGDVWASQANNPGPYPTHRNTLFGHHLVKRAAITHCLHLKTGNFSHKIPDFYFLLKSEDLARLGLSSRPYVSSLVLHAFAFITLYT